MSTSVFTKRWIAAMAIAALIVPSLDAAAQKSAQSQLTITSHAAPDGGAVVVAEGRELRFEYVAYANRFTARVSSQQDEVAVESTADQITVTHNRNSRILRPGSAAEQDFDQIRELLRGSRAVTMLRLALAELEGSNRIEADALLVIAAVIEMLDGDLTAVERRGRAIAEKHRKSLRRASFQTAAYCYWGWEEEVYQATIAYNSCVTDLEWYNLMARLSCSMVYSLRINGAFYWYLGCIAGSIIR